MKKNERKSAKETIDPDILEKRMNINWIGGGDLITGYLCNVKPFKTTDEQKSETACLLLYFIDEQGDHYKAVYNYQPYFYIIVKSEVIFEFLQFITRRFEGKITTSEIIEKVDLDMVNHLSGSLLKVIKLNFKNISDMINVRSTLRPVVQKNKTKEKILSYTELLNPSSKIDMMDMIQDIREDDVPYHVRVCIDSEIRCGRWYDIRHSEEFGCHLTLLPEKLTKADLRVLAFDIETTKAPLKFPDARFDSVMMISYMVDGSGFLITNRSIISEEIEGFDYSPKPEFDGYFHVFNEVDEKALLERFISHCRELRVNVFVTYNGDYFDIPFIAERMKVYSLSIEAELGLYSTGNTSASTAGTTEREFMGRFALHIDCLYWVKRDAFLPQGSHGLKAVTKAKLGYDPIEVDPEKMLTLAKTAPQQLCAYSVSDALATFYLYKLMIHDFILALCTIIPTFPDEVLRKGSGTLCEELLMAQAYRGRILFPNKQVDDFEKFFSGHLIDSETYIGGHVECLNVGVYRSDIPVNFKLDPSAYEYLIENIDNYISFCLKIESGIDSVAFGDKESITQVLDNYEGVQSEITSKLTSLLEMINANPVLEVTPLIYHLDVSAMYPNIILTNRLQPVAIVDEGTCAGCLYNREENNCKRYLSWKWRGELFPLTRSEYENLKHQYEFELLNSAEGDFEELSVEDHRKKFLKRIKNYCQKVYKQVHITKIETKEDIVCMRENSFYVDTVRDFRDRRYEFKNSVKVWKGKLEEARTNKDFAKIEEGKNMMNLFESLQLAHKIILNSFYGYVMRKGARWHSMEMAAMVTHEGSAIITDSRVLVERIGKPLELDTDGIWCLLPLGFPENFGLKLKNGKKVNFSFPCTMLNFLIYEKYCNPQYQELVKEPSIVTRINNNDNTFSNNLNHMVKNTSKVPQYITRTEMSIFFEVDGPYRCMVIPAAKEEGKMLKKRYAVFSHAGKLHELKGFELKRRGELKIIKIFQSEVFDCFLKGKDLRECYLACAAIADRWYSVLENKGEGITDEELLDYIEESRVMSKSVAEYGTQKSTSITCAKRLAEILGSEVIKDKGLCAKYIISNKPAEAPVAERAIPTVIFSIDSAVRRKLLRKWLKDYSIEEVNMREVIDWEYYKTRLGGTILKILIIPAAIQRVENPLPKVPYPDWVNKLMKNKNEEQRNLKFFFKNVSNVDKFMSISGNPEDAEQNTNKMEDGHEGNNLPDNNVALSNNKSGKKPTKNNTLKNFVSKKTKIEYDEENEIESTGNELRKTQLGDGNANNANELINPVNMLEDFTSWLNQQKRKWKSLRMTKQSNQPNKSQTTSVNNPMAFFVNKSENSKETTFKKSLMKIIQVLEGPNNSIKLWVVFDNYMELITLNIKRKILINSHKSDVPDVFKPTKMSLPRNKPVLNLYEFEIEEKEFKEKFNNFNDYIIDSSIEGVYETKVPLLFRVIQEYGCQIRLVNKNKKISAFNNCINTVFNFEDFENKPIFEEDDYPGNINRFYIYHSTIGARHFVALFLPNKKLHIYVVNTITKNVDVPNFKKMVLGVLQKENTEGGMECYSELCEHEILTFVEQDVRIVIKNINKLLYDLKYSNNSNTGNLNNSQTTHNNSLIILQSAYPTSKLIALGFNTLQWDYPVLTIPVASSDNDYPALDWIKFAMKRLWGKYCELPGFLNFRLSMSRYSNIPFCNFDFDPSVWASDVVFARMLKNAKSVLYYSPSGFPDLGGGTEDKDFLGEVEYEFPKILNPGLFLGYSVEIDIGLFCVNAILESDNLKDMSRYELTVNDNRPNNNSHLPNKTTVIDYNLERDEFVLCAQSFHTIKKMAEKLLNDVRQNESIPADILLGNFYRWLSSSNSKFFDPVVHRMINKLMYKYFSILVRKIKEFGFQIIFADYKKVFIFNNKPDFDDFNVNLDYLLRTIKKIHIFNHITLTPNTFWKVILFKDNFNFSGINATEELNNKIVSKWTNALFLPPILEKDFISLISDYLLKLHRFYYDKDITFIADLFNLYSDSQWSLSMVIDFINSDDAVRKFKYFLVNDYLANKVFNMIPNILRKKEEAYEDEEEEKGGLDDLLEEDYNEDADEEENPQGLFTRKDFAEDEDEYEGDLNENLRNVNKNKNNKIKADMWAFPTKLGSYQKPDNSALEYIKHISNVLSLDEEVSEASFILKKNSLKLIKVAEFTQETEFEDPCRTFVLHDIICEYCATNKDLDFCRDGNVLTKAWTCEFCGVQHDKLFIEFLIIHKIKNLIDFYYNQDLKCVKCKMIKNEFIFSRCQCAGQYVSTFDENIFKSTTNIKSVEDYLEVIWNIANYYSFDSLKSMLGSLGI